MGLLLTVVAAVIAYYFAVALTANNRDALSWNGRSSRPRSSTNKKRTGEPEKESSESKRPRKTSRRPSRS